MKPSKKTEVFSIRLKPEVKKEWESYCNRLGKNARAALAEAVESQVKKNLQGKEPEAIKQYKQTKEAPDDEPKFRYEILLTESELRALTERAEAERTSKRRWIVDAIRFGLTNEAQFTMDEIDALGESNYQLLRLGRNLNQVAKAINQSGIQNFDASEILKIRQLIDEHTEKVSTAIGASLHRWLIA